MNADPRALIITAGLDPATQGWLEGLRRTHYPPALNRVPAHLSLIRQLPGSAEPEVRRSLARLARETPPLALVAARWRADETGVALRIDCPALEALRERLVECFTGLLGAADRGRPHPHVTIQNKVSASVARATAAGLGVAVLPAGSRVVALELWRWLDGPWQALARLPLSGPATSGRALARRPGLR